MRRRILPAILLALAMPALGVSAPKKKTNLVWTHPDFASLGITSIALLPVAAYDHDLQDEKLVESGIGLAMRPTGHRWVSPSLSRDVLRSAFGGDSMLRLVTTSIIERGRIDSLAAGPICAALRADAVLTVRIDRFEQIEMEFNQAGRPSTTVQLTAAMVDSLGRLTWSASGSETMEGIDHDPNAATIAVKGSGLTNRPLTGQAGAPRLEEVLAKLMTRWMPRFPSKTAPATAP